MNGTAGSQPSTPGPVTPSSPKSRQEGSDVNTGIEEANPEGPSSKQGEIGLPIGQTCLQYFSCCNADLKVRIFTFSLFLVKIKYWLFLTFFCNFCFTLGRVVLCL